MLLLITTISLSCKKYEQKKEKYIKLEKEIQAGNIASVWVHAERNIERIKKRFGNLELRNRVMQNDATLRVTNSEFFVEILLSVY